MKTIIFTINLALTLMLNSEMMAQNGEKTSLSTSKKLFNEEMRALFPSNYEREQQSLKIKQYEVATKIKLWSSKEFAILESDIKKLTIEMKTTEDTEKQAELSHKISRLKAKNISITDFLKLN